MASAAQRAPTWGRVLVSALLLTLLAPWANAQRINLKAGLVTFAPTAEELIAALDCAPERCLEPAPGSAQVTAKVLRQGQRPVPPLRIEPGGWSTGTGPQLLVRFEVDGVQSPPRRTDWLLLDAPLTLELPSDPVTDVRIEYRLRPDGAVPAGEQRTRIELVVGPSRVEHPLVATLPTATAVRIVGGVAAGGVAVAFDYAPDPLAYLEAVFGGTPLPLTSSQLRAVEVFTNDPRGYRVAVEVRASDGGSALAPERILLFGAPADGLELTGGGPTDGFVPLVLPDDYALRVDGNEAPGAFTFETTFTALPR